VQVYEATWYLRADFAAGFGSDPSVSTSGNPYSSSIGGIGFGLDPTFFQGSFEPSFTGGVGAGYIWNPFIRTDLTVDLHSIMEAKYSGAVSYFDGATNQTWQVQDKSKLMSTILLANLYYDFRTGTPVTPYIGGGVGFAVNQLTRNVALGDSAFVPSTVFQGDRSTQIQFAAAAMLGLNYEISSFTSLDVNYRFLAFGGPSVDLLINNSPSSLSIGGIYEHQIRVGLRFYIN
jgi:opacity protein-like surface antigen